MTEKIEKTVVAVGAHKHDALVVGPADGEPALLLHGWPEFADCWTEELLALGEAGYRAIAVDQRGYAPGARPEGIENYSIEALVSDALGFADSQGYGRFHLVSHDWGGMVAWAFAGAHPDRLKSLTVLATPHPSALQAAAKNDEDQSERLNYVRFFRQPGGVAEASLLADGAARLHAAYGGRIPEHMVAANVRRLTEPGALTATLNWYRGATDDEFTVPAGRITVPTMYLWGADDAKLGRSAAETTGEYVDAEYRFEVLEGVSHWVPEEAPGKVIPLLLEHLGKHRN